MYRVYLYHAQIKELCRCYRPCVCMLCSSFSRLVYTVGYVIMSNHPQYMHTYTNVQYTTHILCSIANYREHTAILHLKISALWQCNQLGFKVQKRLQLFLCCIYNSTSHQLQERAMQSYGSNILCMSKKRPGGGHFFCFASCLAASSCSLYRCMRKQYKVGVYFLSCGLFQHYIINPRCTCAAGLQQFVVFVCLVQLSIR